MSLLIQASQQQKITLSKLLQDGYLLGSAQDLASLSLAPHMVNVAYGKMKATSSEVIAKTTTRGFSLNVRCQCVECGHQITLRVKSLLSGAECRKCCMRKDSPSWVVARAAGMMARCTNQSHKAFKNYGGRGIKFNFKSPRDCADWIMENIPPITRDRNIQLDRIDNDGHYEPGNLRWASKSLNCANTRRGGWVAKTHKFRIDHPEIRYSDKTLRNLMSMGMTPEQIVSRYHKHSDKPKGVYGTYSTPDPEIASLVKDF